MNRCSMVTGAVLMLLVGVASWPSTCFSTSLEPQGLFLDWSDEDEYPPAHPNTPRALGVDILYWAGNPFLILNNGFGVLVYGLSNPLLPEYQSGMRVLCPQVTVLCPLQLLGDYDHMLYRLATCTDCPLAVAACGTAGSLVYSWKDYGNGIPRVGPWQVITSSSKGAATFSEGGQQFILSSGWSDGCSNTGTLWRVASVEPIVLEVQQCLPSTSVSDAFRIDDHLYLVTSASTVDSYLIVGSGEDLWLSLQSSPLLAPAAVFGRGFRVDVLGHQLITAAVTTELWSATAPAEPLFLAVVPGQWDRVAIDGPYAWTTDGRVSMTWNLNDPTLPQELDPQLWDADDLANTHLRYLRQSPRDAVIVEIAGQRYLYVADYTVAWTGTLTGLPPIGSLHSDSFETGDTSTWSATVG